MNNFSRGVTVIEVSFCLILCAISVLGLLAGYRKLVTDSQQLQQQFYLLSKMVALLEHYPAQPDRGDVSELYLQIEPTKRGCDLLKIKHPHYNIKLTRVWCDLSSLKPEFN